MNKTEINYNLITQQTLYLPLTKMAIVTAIFSFSPMYDEKVSNPLSLHCVLFLISVYHLFVLFKNKPNLTFFLSKNHGNSKRKYRIFLAMIPGFFFLSAYLFFITHLEGNDWSLPYLFNSKAIAYFSVFLLFQCAIYAFFLPWCGPGISRYLGEIKKGK